MSQLVFAAPPVVTAPVRGRSERVPIRRIFCVGRNYEAHAREMGVAVDREAPFYFTKAAEHYVRVRIDGAVSARHVQLSLRAGARRGDRGAGVPRAGAGRPRLCVRLCVRARHDPARPAVCRARAAPALGSGQRRRAVGRAVRDRSGDRDRSSRRRPDRAARQWRASSSARTSRS